MYFGLVTCPVPGPNKAAMGSGGRASDEQACAYTWEVTHDKDALLTFTCTLEVGSLPLRLPLSPSS